MSNLIISSYSSNNYELNLNKIVGFLDYNLKKF